MERNLRGAVLVDGFDDKRCVLKVFGADMGEIVGAKRSEIIA
jgi:hypothetical protein